MKRKLVISLALAAASIAAQAQTVIATPRFDSNWSAGFDGGVSTPLDHGHAFFGDMRAIVGAHVQKQISPAFGLGAEATFGINTSSWYGHHQVTAFDNSYVGLYGAVNLMNLFGGFNCAVRPFEIEVVAGAGWGHDYAYNGPNENYGRPDWNYFATRAGLNFNFNINSHVTISVKPYMMWNMTGSPYEPEFDVKFTSAAYTRKLSTFNCLVGLTYNFGPRFQCVTPGNSAETDALNDEINRLRADIAACNAATAAAAATAADLATQLQACQNRKPEVVKEVNN
ncbi:MAG: OmpA family protein, partial [Firmicutes bacterium]|nr:OmpA family protein [Bacillota bacterium]MCM1477886.1 OmpA family protein [Bacteroides sp.]